MDTSQKSISFGNVTVLQPKLRSSTRRPLQCAPANVSRLNSSRVSISGRSTQSIPVIYKTPYHVVESFGASLPVMVTEALAFAERTSTVSVRLSTSGWAWFVCGRRLLIWQYRQEGHGRWAPGSQCRELTLPPSDLAHRAQLVNVFIPDNSSVPACIAVSPEGAVRFWPTIAHEGTWTEENADLRGQECDSLSEMTSLGCILATTTATICVLAPKNIGGRQSIQCHTLRTADGWLGGIGRKFSSYLFGSGTTQNYETRLVKVVPMKGDSQSECKLLVLAGHTLQKWHLSSKTGERLIFEFDMDRLTRDHFLHSVWDAATNSAQDLTIWMLDMQLVQGGVILLAAAANTNLSATVYYAAVLVMTENEKGPEAFQMFCPLKLTDYYHGGEETESEGLSYQFLLYGPTALVFNSKRLIATTVSQSQEEPDRIEFITAGDCILGGALCGNLPIFFSRQHGLVSVTTAETSPLDFMNTSASISESHQSFDRLSMSQFSDATMISSTVAVGTTNITLTGAHLEDLATDKDDTSRLKAAFVYFSRRDTEECQEIIVDAFPPKYVRQADVDCHLDIVVNQVCEDIINDVPATDPRWAESFKTRPGVTTTSSIQIMQQLQGKLQTLELYINFLKGSNIWERLAGLTIRNSTVATTHILQEHAEKIIAAIALRNLQQLHSEVVDKAIRSIMIDRKQMNSGSLTHLDLFYREVSKIHEIFKKFGQISNDAVMSNKSPSEICEILQQNNSIILGLLKEILSYRKSKNDLFAHEPTMTMDAIEYLPWTASSGEDGIQETLLFQFDTCMDMMRQDVINNVMMGAMISDDLKTYVDILLDGYRAHLESIKGGERYDYILHRFEKQRYELISPFLNVKLYEHATKISEKYFDYEHLIKICEILNTPNKIEQYINKYADEGFSEFLLNWFVKENKQDILLSYFDNANKTRPIQHEQAVKTFLQLHPHLSWIHSARCHQYVAATESLYGLGKEETEKLSRKKTMLSLAKISIMASDEAQANVEAAIENINKDLSLISYQEELPASILDYLNTDIDNMPVYKPEQLIDLYISNENINGNEFDFKKALELINFIDDPALSEELKLKIWCKSILRDSWEDLDLAYPAESCKDLLFFKLIDNIITEGSTEYMVSMDLLMEGVELESLVHNKSFKYMIQYIYEQLSSTLEISLN